MVFVCEFLSLFSSFNFVSDEKEDGVETNELVVCLVRKGLLSRRILNSTRNSLSIDTHIDIYKFPFHRKERLDFTPAKNNIFL